MNVVRTWNLFVDSRCHQTDFEPSTWEFMYLVLNAMYPFPTIHSLIQNTLYIYSSIIYLTNSYLIEENAKNGQENFQSLLCIIYWRRFKLNLVLSQGQIRHIDHSIILLILHAFEFIRHKKFITFSVLRHWELWKKYFFYLLLNNIDWHLTVFGFFSIQLFIAVGV